MATPACVQLLEVLRAQLPSEFDELCYFATDDPLVFYASVMSAHDAGRLALSPELKRTVREGLIEACRGTRPAPHVTSLNQVIVIPPPTFQAPDVDPRPDEGELTGAL